MSTEKTGVQLIAEEREEQISKHGRTVESDVTNNGKWELRNAATTIIARTKTGVGFPEHWDQEMCRKMNAKSYKQRLIIAGALIAAEIDRLNALESKAVVNENTGA